MKSIFVDLSLPFSSQLPVYPGDPAVSIQPVLSVEKDGCSVHQYSFSGHTGTHIDAPAHFLKDGMKLSDIALERFCGKATVLDVRSQNLIHYNIVNHSTKYIDTVILLRTEYSNNWMKKDYYSSFPTVSEKLADELVRAKIKMIGIDGPSVDKDHEPYPVHKIFLKAGIPILENLSNLGVVQDRNITLFAFPLLVATDGIPVRVVAQVHSL